MKSPKRSLKRSQMKKKNYEFEGGNLKGGYDLQGGEWCSQEMRDYATVILVCAALYIYYRNANLKYSADAVFEFTKTRLSITAKGFMALWNAALSLFEFNYSFVQAFSDIPEIASGVFNGALTIGPAALGFVSLKIFNKFVYALCVFLTQFQKVAKLYYQRPRLATTVALLLVYAGQHIQVSWV